ncbi:MAG: type IX secretion system membrane protein PorP/SprF [Cyclobacteriaceae bacterium]|nr:type IX secretion system membrane protein PorP/SprF [Cyclobacteriaceae bacterium]
MNKKCVIGLLLCFLALGSAFGQQRPIVSQYMFNGLVLNPAYAGRHEYTSFSAMYRDQWINVPGAPQLGVFTMQTGFKDRNVGAGLIVANDAIGVHNDMSVYGIYSYSIEVKRGAKLSMGLQAGFNNLRSDFNRLNLPPGVIDPFLSGVNSNFYPNFGTGLFYFDESFYAGFSVPYILTNHRRREGDFFQDTRHSRYYYITAGKVFDMSQRVKLKPSGLLRVEENMPFAFDLNTNVYFDELVGIGASYRFQESVALIMELWINQYLKFSYAYDYITSDLTTYTNGTHEFMLNYRLNFNAPKKHRMCPGPLFF